jgi:hypothetical protein
MNRFWWMMMFRLLDPVDSGAGGSGAAAPSADPAPAPVAAADPAPAAAAPAADPAAPAADPAAPAADPNDPYALLEAAMRAELGEVAPAAPKPGEPGAPAEGEQPPVPEAFAPALEISSFVKSPEQLQTAVRAADEVWQVATGQVPARQLLEGFKTTSPQQYQAIVADLKDYLGVTGSAAPQPGPLDALKQANPDAYAQIANFVEQVTGKPLEGPADPMQARLSTIEQRFAQEEQARQAANVNQQISKAREVGVNFLTEKLKGTFLEGQTDYVWAQVGAKADVSPQQMTEMLLSGKTDKLERAFRAVQKDEATRLQAYNANLIKKHRTLANAVPAVKGGAAQPAAGADAKAQRPGESDNDWRMRLWNANLV